MFRENTIEIGDKLIARDGTIGKVRAVDFNPNNDTCKIIVDMYLKSWNIESVQLNENEMEFILIKN